MKNYVPGKTEPSWLPVIKIAAITFGVAGLMLFAEDTFAPGISKFLWQSVVYTSCWPRCDWPPL